MRFIVYSSGHNCGKFVKKHLQSIQGQTYKNYVHIAVDDGSTDNTFKKLKKYRDGLTVIHRNKSVQRVAKNWIDYLKPTSLKYSSSVIIWIGMDDWLASDDVFEKINDIYENEDVWLTYGSFVYLSNPHKKFPIRAASRQELENKKFRAPPNKAIWLYQPLQTFKCFLFNNIRKDDFRGPDGEWIPSSNDRALMYAMLEMSQPDKVRYVKDILYIYNDLNPLCVHKSGRLKEQIKYEYLAYTRKKYETIQR